MPSAFVCFGFDDPAQLSIRLTHRNDHLARISALSAQGRIVIAGPMTPREDANPSVDGFVGSLIIAQFENLAVAQAWWGADPYVLHGVFKHWGVHPFHVAFPKSA
jgi:uncharacterized protein YciI